MASARRGKRFGWLLLGTALLVILTILFTLRTPDNVQDVGGDRNVERYPIQIVQIQLRVMESFPVQGMADVRGIIPDACSSVREPEVTRSGYTFTIKIIGERPRDRACAQVIREYQRNIPLGALQPGDYVLHVNDVTTRFHID